MEKTKLTPVDGRTVPLEDGTPWPTDKKDKPIDHEVVMTRYYRRRVRDGDLQDKAAEKKAADELRAAEAAGKKPPKGDK